MDYRFLHDGRGQSQRNEMCRHYAGLKDWSELRVVEELAIGVGVDDDAVEPELQLHGRLLRRRPRFFRTDKLNARARGFRVLARLAGLLPSAALPGRSGRSLNHRAQALDRGKQAHQFPCEHCARYARPHRHDGAMMAAADDQLNRRGKPACGVLLKRPPADGCAAIPLAGQAIPPWIVSTIFPRVWPSLFVARACLPVREEIPR
jgi:hypothetical protein